MPGLKQKVRRENINRVSLLTLFFCLISSLCFAAKPSGGKISPDGLKTKGTRRISHSAPLIGGVIPITGRANADQTTIFTTIYGDPDTWLNIQSVYLLINNNSTLLKNSFFGYYDQNTDKLYLRDDNDKTWLGGYSPGSNNTIENSYAKLNCAQTTTSGSGDILTVNWAVSFKSSFGGIKTVYLAVKDDDGGYLGWIRKGGFCIFRQPLTPPNN